MSQDQLLDQLQKMLAWKKSKKFYADRLRMTEQELDELMKMIKSEQKPKDDETIFSEASVKFEQDLEKETGVLEYKGPKQLKTKEDLVRECQIDLKDWDIIRMIHNAWGTNGNTNFQTKAILSPKSRAKHFGEEFKNFLKSYQAQPCPVPYVLGEFVGGTPTCLVLNVQDAHLNKYDIGGDNNVQERFDKIEFKINKMLMKAAVCSDLEKVIYVIGSDLFNSEWTNSTTKGTPQVNALPYQQSFEVICDHEIRVIDALLSKSKTVDIVYVPGNHDEYVGWHMINWLKAYYKNQPNLTIDSSYFNRKYVKYSNTAIMFNHGDGPKPIQLASMFPVEFRERWSECDHTYIFTGHFHREMYADFNGTKFYGLPALSRAKGAYDDKKGYTTIPPEIKGFLIESENGLTDIYSELL